MTNFLKLHSTYENKAVRILLKEFRKMSAKIPFDVLTKDNAESVIKLTINNEELNKALFKVHLTIGKSYGNMEARRFRREIKKWKPLPLFNEAFQRYLLKYYADFGGENITLLTDTYVQAVVSEIRKATFENETVIQMRDRIFKTVNSPNFYKWQALRIARTETTFAMNSAKQIAGEVSGLVMEKVWISVFDNRTRSYAKGDNFDHLEMNGKTVLLNEYFNVGGEKMAFPGDKSSASAGNIINCRCTWNARARRDANGNLIFTD